MKLYLTGPITGKTADRIRDWRKEVRVHFEGRLDVIDPAEAKFDVSLSHLSGETPGKALKRLKHGTFVVARSKALIGEADLVLANFLGAGERTSIGSVAEIAWANAMGKPIIIVREPHGNVHDHAMLNGMAVQICHSLADALDKIDEMAGLKAPLVRSANA